MKFLFAFLITFFTLVSSAQNFEGKIIYTNDYVSKTPSLSSKSYTRLAGDTQQYFYKNGYYKSITNGLLAEWQLYITVDNKIYNQLSTSKKLLWIDAGIANDTLIEVTINKNTETILGYLCDEMIFETKKGTQKYYYNNQLSVNPELFINHKYCNWYDYISRAKALPLKSIIETDDFILTSIAIETQRVKLEDSIFKLPENAEFKKMPL